MAGMSLADFLHTSAPMAPQTRPFLLVSTYMCSYGSTDYPFPVSFAVYSVAAIISLIVKEFGLIFIFTLTLQFSLEQGEKEFQKKRGHFIPGSGINPTCSLITNPCCYLFRGIKSFFPQDTKSKWRKDFDYI